MNSPIKEEELNSMSMHELYALNTAVIKALERKRAIQTLLQQMSREELQQVVDGMVATAKTRVV